MAAQLQLFHWLLQRNLSMRQPNLKSEHQGSGLELVRGWGSELWVHAEQEPRANPGRRIAQLFGTVDNRCVRPQRIIQVAGLEIELF